MATGSILFVHGSGNRAADAAAYGAKLTAGLKLGPGIMHLSSWGDAVGPNDKFPRLSSTMPTVAAAFGPAQDDVLTDPYAPLRALGGGVAGAFAGSGKSDARAVLAFLQSGGLDLEGTPVSADQLAAAATEVAASPEFADASGDPVALIDAAVTTAAARAVQRQGPDAIPAGAFGFNPIDKVKEAIAKAAMGTVGILGTTAGRFSGPIARWLSEQFAPRRQALMQEHILVAADVLYYQRHSDRIRKHVRTEIQQLPKPRLVMGHSLGGIILVDTLFARNAPDLGVDLLVTFGSQSPLLAALEAFDRVVPNVPWLNIWTTFDFVSFLANGIWPGKATDHEIVVDAGFPEAHGAYYDSPAFYKAIGDHPAAAAVLS